MAQHEAAPVSGRIESAPTRHPLLLVALVLLACATARPARALVAVRSPTAAVPPGTSQQSSPGITEEELDALLASIDPEGPGKILVAVTPEETVFAARGRSCQDAPIGPSTTLAIASLSKAMIAHAAVRLADAAREPSSPPVDLDADLRPVVDALAGYPEAVCLRQLLDHRAGLREASSLAVLRRLSEDSWLHHGRHDDSALFVGADELLYALAAEPTFQFTPGTSFEYCNSNFLVALIALAELSGQSPGSVLERQVFQPLGMVSSSVGANQPTGLRRTDPDGVAERALESRAERSSSPPFTLMIRSPDLSAWSTADDLARWMGAVLLRVRPRGSFWEHCSPEHHYSLGWAISRWRGLHILSHSGSLLGFPPQPGVQHFLVLAPERGVGVACLGFQGKSSARDLALSALGQVLGEDQLAEVAPPRPLPATLPAGPMHYGSEDGRWLSRVTVDDDAGTLRLTPGGEMAPRQASDTAVLYEAIGDEASWTGELRHDLTSGTLRLQLRGRPAITLHPLSDGPGMPSFDLAGSEGSYARPGYPRIHLLPPVDDPDSPPWPRVGFAERPPGPLLVAGTDDAVAMGSGLRLHLIRNGSGEVVALELHALRGVRGLRFRRLDPEEAP